MNRLLIANRAEIARRIIRTARAMGIATVAVHSDADANALHVREADAAVALGGTASADSYLRIDRIIAAARASGADAVHPGYGFLSENADFAQAVVDAGLVWVGPPAAAIRALGSKSSAKRLAREQGVPVLPGYEGADQGDDCFMREATQIGYPVMVKAAAGGGGRGMRLVMQPADLPAALASARAEALAGFGSDELLMERALLAPRHVEVQVFADTHGHCVHLGERDCSVQRRHQKIIEESPSPAVDAGLRERMGRAAVALARAAGYVGAGTVEFLVDGAQFHLMEMNTRLQVEHPVTEMRLGVDLVRWQISVARGGALPMDQAQVDAALDAGGHAVEVRLCAEDEHFMPRTGQVQAFIAPPGVRFDHALHTGSVVTPHYDSMLGKLIAHAPTRAQAIGALATALDHTAVLGLPTNRAFLAACLRHEVFRAGQALIPFIAQHGQALREGLGAARHATAMRALMAVHMMQGASIQGASIQGMPQAPHRLHCAFARPLRMRWHDADTASAAHMLSATALEQTDGSVWFETLTAQATPQVSVARAQARQGCTMTLTVDGLAVQVTAVALSAAGEPDGPCWHVQVDGVELWLQDMSFAPARHGTARADADLKAPFNGKVIQVVAQPGQRVRRGDTLVVIESMKLQHNLSAPAEGEVGEVIAQPGQQVGPGQVLVRMAAPEHST